MNSNPSRAALYSERTAHFQAEADALGARSTLLSNLRGLAFGGFVLATGFTLFGSAGTPGAVVATVSFVCFIRLIVWHARVIEREDDRRRWARVNRDAHARVTGLWRELPERGDKFRDAKHPYSEDLDVFGPSSLYQRVCVAHTRYGQRALARMFSSPATLAEVGARQATARALSNALDARQELEAMALAVVDRPQGEPAAKRGAHKEPPDPEPLLIWAESAPVLINRPIIAVIARVLPVITVGLAIASSVAGLPSLVWAIPLFLQIGLNFHTREATFRVFGAVSASEGAFLRYGAMLELIEKLNVDADLVTVLRQRLVADAAKPSAAMHAFRRAVSWFDLRHNGLIHPFANALLMWDVNCTLRLERWQVRHGRHARGWFEVLGEFEALSSIAGLAHDEPDYVFPELTEGGEFQATALGHPLIAAEQRVTNDVSLSGPGTALLITGSNMSGKSTLLRAMGLGAVMALAGCPVCAGQLRIGRLAIRTSIRVSDSLESGVSHFYAELSKLKTVLEATSGPDPVLFLLDEILHGTNSRERQAGARWIIAELLRRGATGAVSTHDMGLVTLPPDLARRVQLVHFRENVQDDKMTFDYKLRQGPVTAGNALRLMRMIGLEVPLDDEQGLGTPD
jgi:ABC-type multidrug transport system fused ATPase/permease subunit